MLLKLQNSFCLSVRRWQNTCWWDWGSASCLACGGARVCCNGMKWGWATTRQESPFPESPVVRELCGLLSYIGSTRMTWDWRGKTTFGHKRSPIEIMQEGIISCRWRQLAMRCRSWGVKAGTNHTCVDINSLHLQWNLWEVHCAQWVCLARFLLSRRFCQTERWGLCRRQYFSSSSLLTCLLQAVG